MLCYNAITFTHHSCMIQRNLNLITLHLGFVNLMLIHYNNNNTFWLCFGCEKYICIQQT